LEVAAFLLLIVPSMVISYWVIRPGDLGFGLTAVSIIFRDLGLTALVLFFLWRNREKLGDVGVTGSRTWVDVGLGLILFPLFYFGMQLVERVFIDLGLSVPRESNPIALPGGAVGEIALGVVLVAVVAFSEELIFRGYLINRFRASGLGTASAVLVSTVVFALGHGYEGAAGVATVGVMGLVFALIYLWRRSLTASMTLHFLQDLLLVVILPLVSAK
jgi:membrane protease YdiL (CAAX protease family)